MSDGEAGGQQSKDQEGLGRSLVLDVVGDGVGDEELCLEEHLREDEAEEDGSIGVLMEACVQIRGDTELGDVDGADADPLCSVDAKSHWERLEAQRSISLDRFEIIDNGDTQTSEGVEDGEHHDVDGELAKEGLPCPPRKSDVGRA